MVKLCPLFHPPYSVFISYPDENEYHKDVILAFLNFMDVTCYVAKHQKEAGEELWDKISSEIKASTRILLLYTHFATSSKWIEREIAIARTFKKRFIPVKEEDVELPDPVRGEDREYIPFKKDDFISTLVRICHQVYDYRDRTPHVFRFTNRGRSTGMKLIVTPWTNQAFWTDAYVDSLVERGVVQESKIDFIGWSRATFSTWPAMQGLELLGRPARPDDLGF